MSKRIFVTGAGGFVGTAVLRQLLNRGYSVHGLVHGRPLAMEHPQLTAIHGGLFNTASLEEGLRGCDAAVHLVGIIAENRAQQMTFQHVHVEGTRHLVQAMQQIGVPRLVHISAAGTRPNASTAYHRTKYQAEQIVRSSDRQWTIFRPSLIHGPGGEFSRLMTSWARGQAAPYLFMPYFGRGLLGTGQASLLQPVLVDDVARAVAEALENPGTIGKIYDLGGAQALNWPQMMRTFAAAIIGKPKPAAPIPAWLAKGLSRILPERLLGFSRDQVVMSQEDNTCDMKPFRADFGWEPAGFEAALGNYARAT